MFTTTITPQTHPADFVTFEIGGFKFWVRREVSVRLQEARDDAWRDAYSAACPDECKEGLDEIKYNSWLRTKEGDRAADRCDMRLLFIPHPDQAIPQNFPMEEYVTRKQLQMAQGFFGRLSSISTPEPRSSSEATAVNQDSVTSSSQS